MLPLSPAILLQVTRADVGRMLRDDAFSLGLGVLLVAVGVAAALLYVRSSRRKEPSLLWFGLFAFLYGLRLLARTETFRLVFDLPPTFWPYLISATNYVIPLPALLFLRAAFPRWRRPLGWAVIFMAAFAAGGLAADAVRQRPDAARTPNNLIAIAFLGGSLSLL